MAQPFRPTLKERKRYVAYKPVDDAAVADALQEIFGVRTTAQAGLLPVENDGTTSIMRVAHTCVDELKAALAWTGKHSLTTSGTLKQAREYLNAS